MIYNEFFENTGECETSFFLGCRDCKECRVKLYNRKVEEELRKENEREQKFLEKMYGNIEFEFDKDDDPYWVQRELEEFQAKQHEINMLRKTLEELREVDIIETAKSVVNKQIRKNIEEIEKAGMAYDQLTIDAYKSLFEVDLTQMTEEQINNIDLTAYTDCVPW